MVNVPRGYTDHGDSCLRNLSAQVRQPGEQRRAAHGSEGGCGGSGRQFFLADRFNNPIQKFTNTGTLLAKWDSLGLGDGEFSDLESVAVDGDGHVFADVDRIQKFTNDGIFITQWGSLGNADGHFNSAIAVATDGDGNVFVGEENQRVQKFACP